MLVQLPSLSLVSVVFKQWVGKAFLVKSHGEIRNIDPKPYTILP